MQVNFNPMPTTGDIITVEAPPTVDTPTGEIQPDGSGSGNGATSSQKDFRETMDDLLRGAEKGDLNANSQPTPATTDAVEKVDAEVALVEITALPLQPQQKESGASPTDTASVEIAGKGVSQGNPAMVGPAIPPQIDRLPQKGAGDASTPANAKGGSAAGSFEVLRSVVQSEASGVQPSGNQAESPKGPPVSVPADISKAPSVGVQSDIPKVSTSAQREAGGVQPATIQGEAVALGLSRKTALNPKGSTESKPVAEPKVNGAQTEPLSLGEARVTPSKSSGTGETPSIADKQSLSKVPLGNGSNGSQLTGNPGRGMPEQVHPSRQDTLNGDTVASAPPMDATTKSREGQPQSFTTLVESIEKGGAEAKPIPPVTEPPLDAVTTSGTKHSPNPQSAISHIAKADPATPQPVIKEEVVQQIVDSAKLRFQNGKGEMRIQLKPESLGHVRLNISTDHHQVMVKVVAELPMVKEILESNLPQLRAELQGQGLEIDKFDVSVGGDRESQNKEQQTGTQRQNGRRGGGSLAQGDKDNPGEKSSTRSNQQQTVEGEADGVDYFA